MFLMRLMSDMGIDRVDPFTLVDSGNSADTISSKWRRWEAWGKVLIKPGTWPTEKTCLPRFYVVSRHGHSVPRYTQQSSSNKEGGANPFRDRTCSLRRSVNGTVETLLFHLQGHVILSRALNTENLLVQGEMNCYLREQVHTGGPPVGNQPITEQTDWSQHRTPHHCIIDDRGRAVTTGTNASSSQSVIVCPIGVRTRFLPLGNFFQEGETCGSVLPRLQGWPDAIDKDPSARPCGVRRWVAYLISLNHLFVYTQTGQILYGGNRPPDHRDPLHPQQWWRATKAAFFHGMIAIILRLRLFDEISSQLALDQRAPCGEPPLVSVEDPNHLNPKDPVQRFVRTGTVNSWLRLDTVIRYGQPHLHDWCWRSGSPYRNSTISTEFLAKRVI